MRILQKILSVLAVIILAACTQYNGYIGPIFGSWSLVGITEDGVALPLEDETVFSFQNEIVQVLKLGELQQVELARYGNFKVTDSELTMRFQAGPTATGSYMYVIPHWLHFPLTGEPLHFGIRKLTGSEMELTLDTGTKNLGYSFRKTW